MSPTAEASRERDRNLLFLTTPALWPAWPFLPLMRRRPGAEEECGLLYDALHRSGTAGYSAAVLLCNLFQLPPTEEELLALPKEVHDCPEEIVAAGWRVD
jgi:hypothetical protein